MLLHNDAGRCINPSGPPKVVESTLTAGTSPLVIDVEGSLGRLGEKGYIVNDSVVSLTFAVLHAVGGTYDDPATLAAGENFDLTGRDVSSIRLVRGSADAAFRLNVM
jgi:hypothetical protein